MGEGGLQRSTLPEIYENHALFGSRNFVLLPFHVIIPWRPNGSRLILGLIGGRASAKIYCRKSTKTIPDLDLGPSILYPFT